MNKLTIILFLILTSSYGQKPKSDYEISGNLKIQIGNDLLVPIEATILLQPNMDLVEVDKLGNYKFRGLKNGIYELSVLDYNFEPELIHFEIKDKSINGFNLVVNANCEINKQIAETDLKNGKPKLILIGGIAPVINFDDGEVANKYGVVFYDYGCTPPPMECVHQYNLVVFDYLDNKFGKKWREEVRDDVIGLK